MSYSSKYADRHRAEYMLVRGVWKARCRLCAWETADPMRRQAMALFRAHIKEVKASAVETSNGHDADTPAIEVVDLRDSPGAPLAQPT